MSESEALNQTPPDSTAQSEPVYPPGDHPLEVAARCGFGPLSPLSEAQWHGRGKPCVSCGQLVLRDTAICSYCEQDLSREMLEKMKAHAGPWYVLEHVRPFPGVTLDRIVRQIRRGLITETSIVRGPSSDYQWRFAVETPGLCRYFGRCWQCHETVSPSDTNCQHCLAQLSFERPPAGRPQISIPKVDPRTAAPSALGHHAASANSASQAAVLHQAQVTPIAPPLSSPGQPSPSAHSSELLQLSEALHHAELKGHDGTWDAPPRIGGIPATWVVAGVLVLTIAGLLLLT